MTKAKATILGSVSVGDKFVFRTAEIMGPEYSSKNPPGDGQVFSVVGFMPPRHVSRVVVIDSDGRESLLRLDMAEKALKLQESEKIVPTVLLQLGNQSDFAERGLRAW